MQDFDKKEITNTEKVEITTLDNLIKKYGVPKLIKIDVEGFEKKVLKGLSKKIKFISFEFSGNTFNETKKCVNEILKKNKNVLFNLTSGEDMILAFNNWKNSEEILKYIKNHPKLNGDIHVKN